MLLRLREVEQDSTRHLEARVVEESIAALPATDTIRALVDEANRNPERRAELLCGLRAQLAAFSQAWSPRLILPCSLIMALGLALAVALLTVGYRVERSLALFLLAPGLGLTAWFLVLGASAVATALHVRLGRGTVVGVGRGLRMILEHGNGATGSALRFVVIGVVLATALLMLALLGAFPGLIGPAGLAVTGFLLWVQMLAAVAAVATLAGLAVALLLHPALAAAGASAPGQVFRFVFRLLRRRAPEVISRVALPLGTTLLLGFLGYRLLGSAFALVFQLNQRVLGPVFGELLAASPIRFLFGAPELLDPTTAVSVAGTLVAVSLILCFALLLGFLASFAGISGLLLGYGLDLTRRFKAGGEETG